MENLRLICLMLLVSTMAVAQTTSAGRIFTCDSLPIVKPNSFSSSDFMYVKKDSSTWMWKVRWLQAPIRLNAKDGKDGQQGVQGIQGVQGVAGVCPPCNGTTSMKGFVSNWTEFVQAYNDKSIKTITLTANITQTSKWRLDNNYSGITCVNGNGYEWIIPSNIDTGIIKTYPSLTAANQGIDNQLRFENIIFKGNNNICMFIEATYGSKIEGCRFYQFKYAIDFRWCMGAIIEQCYFWENYVSIHLDYARFVGGSNSESQSNHPFIAHNKFRSKAGGLADIELIAVSGAIEYHDIHEGDEFGGDYHVIFNDANSTVVKDLTIESDHIENIARIASYDITMKEGIASYNKSFSQKNNLVRFTSSAYAKLIVSNVAWLTSGSKFENVRSEGRWIFENLPSSFTPTSTDRWIGAMPINSRYDFNESDGQKSTIFLNGRKL